MASIINLCTRCIGHFVNHAQNKVKVKVGGLTRFVNITGWMKKVKRSIIGERG